MKFYKALPLLSVIFALVLSLSVVGVLGAPKKESPLENQVVYTPANTNADLSFEGTRVVAVAEKQEQQVKRVDYDINLVLRVLQLNRVYGDWLYDDAALIEEAQLSLIDKIETIDGKQVISRRAVQEFVYTLYGRTVDADNTDEYYIVSPRGYEPMGHEITQITEKDGLLLVTSKVRFGGNEPLTAQTVLAPCQNDFGYMILSADITE